VSDSNRFYRSSSALSGQILRQQVDDVKTIHSGKLMSIDPQMLRVLKAWRQNARFSSEEDWMFASPAQVGRLPVSYP
jgi:hypothetical protein